MKRLNKGLLTAKEKLITELRKAGEKIELKNGELETAIGEYNAILEDVESFRDEIVGEMESFYDDKSEKWQEGENGQNYEGWKSDWEGLEVGALDPPDLPDLQHADLLEALTDEPE